MRKHNADNERIKRKYLIFEAEARQQSEASIDSIAKSIARFEEYTKWRDFKRFHYEQAIGFKRHLSKQLNQATGKSLSKSTIRGVLAQVAKFFQWLSQQPGYKSRVTYSDAEYFKLSAKEARIATATKPTSAPTVDQIEAVVGGMPTETDIQLRDRALIAFTLLSGARDGAIASLKMRHINMEERSVYQDARDVNTKFSKTFVTYFFPVKPIFQEVFAEWVHHLTGAKGWAGEDPLFPTTLVKLTKNGQFSAGGLKREHWKTATPIRRIFSHAFEAAGLPYFNPHSFRNALVRMAEEKCKTPEEFKAWSQNLGHERVMTTFTNYGEVSSTRQQQLLQQDTFSSNNLFSDGAEEIATKALLAIKSLATSPPK